jgi:hypothetical protein
VKDDESVINGSRSFHIVIIGFSLILVANEMRVLKGPKMLGEQSSLEDYSCEIGRR